MTQRWLPDDLPGPWASQDTAGWWQAALEHRLVVQRCTDCGVARHPPAPICAACRGFGHELVELPGTGTVFTFTRVHQAFVPSLTEHLPYVVAVVDLDLPDGVDPGPSGAVRIVSNVVEADPAAVAIGQRVRVAWQDVGDELALPRFRPIEGTS